MLLERFPSAHPEGAPPSYRSALPDPNAAAGSRQDQAALGKASGVRKRMMCS